MKSYIPSSPNDLHRGPITKVRFSPSGSHFYTSSLDGDVKIYDAVTGKCVNTIEAGHSGASIIGIDYSKSGNHLLTTGLDGLGRLWDLSSGKSICTYAGAAQKV